MKTLPLICLGAAMLALLAGAQDTKRVGDPYPLTICPISKRPLGPSAVVVVLEDMPDANMNGREVKFCCNGCPGRFMADPVASNGKLDEAIMIDQMKVYPITPCVVMPEDDLADPRGPEAMEDKNVVIGNRLYRFCCKGCIRKFKKDPAKYATALDKVVIAQQAPTYPLDVCVITDRPLGENPTEFVVANRLVRTCCGGCAKKVKASPTETITKLDKARTDKAKKTAKIAG